MAEYHDFHRKFTLRCAAAAACSHSHSALAACHTHTHTHASRMTRIITPMSSRRALDSTYSHVIHSRVHHTAHRELRGLWELHSACAIDEYSATWLIAMEYSIDTQILVSYRKYSILSIAPPILSICPTMHGRISGAAAPSTHLRQKHLCRCCLTHASPYRAPDRARAPKE